MIQNEKHSVCAEETTKIAWMAQKEYNQLIQQ